MTRQEWLVIKRVDITDRHLRPGRTKHYLGGPKGGAEFPPFTSLVIAQYPEDSGYYLLHLCDDGTGTDTYHATIDEAFHQAAYEFDVKPEEWTEVGGSGSQSQS
jgi:hypothetical protein